mgnify:CR=1 FL=1
MLKAEKLLSDNLFTFIESNYLRVKYSGYSYRSNVGPGLGYHILKSDTQKLKTSVNALFSKDKNEGGSATKEESYSAYKVALAYELNLNANTTFKESSEYQSGDSENYFVTSLTELNVKMSDTLSLGVSYKLDYQDSPVATGTKRIDRTFLTSLIIDY